MTANDTPRDFREQWANHVAANAGKDARGASMRAHYINAGAIFPLEHRRTLRLDDAAHRVARKRIEEYKKNPTIGYLPFEEEWELAELAERMRGTNGN